MVGSYVSTKWFKQSWDCLAEESMYEKWTDTNLDGERRLSDTTVSQHHQLVQSHLSVRHLDPGVLGEYRYAQGSRVRGSTTSQVGQRACLSAPKLQA